MDAVVKKPRKASPVNTILHGDCLKLLAKTPAESIDLAFADPPFNIGYDYDVYDDSRERDDYLAWSQRWISAVHRVLKPHGTFWLAIGDEYAAELKVMAREIGFHTRSWVVWYYTFGVNCSRKFTRSHAHMFHFVKDAENFTFRENDLANRVPSARQLVYADKRAHSHGRLPDDTWILRPQDAADCFTPDEDLWYFPRVAGTFKERAGFHGCQMPEQLLGRIIRTCSNPGDVVLDPFSGSATTAAVAKKLGRGYLAFDLSEEYAQRGLERLERCRFGDPLVGSEEPRVSAPSTPAESQEPLKSKQGRKSPTQWIDSADDTAFENGLLRAYADSYAGFSLDRVLADPQTSARLEYACRQLGLSGDARSWFRSLFRLRKSGRLTEYPTEKRTEMSWAECDPFIYGSEIALRLMADETTGSIDDILCDPMLAARFDALAATIAPGCSPFQYRWAAVKLRKEAKTARHRAGGIAIGSLGEARSLASLNKGLEKRPGVYLVTKQSNGQALYAGGTLDLQARFARQFSEATLPHWQAWKEMHAFIVPMDSDSPADLLAYQYRLIAEHQPAWNPPDFAE